MSADTRQRILDTALRLFESDGYAGTTMRGIAKEAGLSPSNAYYWFDSKDDLVQAFYERIQVEHRERVAAELAAGGNLQQRLAAVEHAFLDVVERYHGFGTAFVGTALNPRSSTSPFSAESAPARELSLQIYRDLVAGASPAVPRRIAAVLPDLLWLCHLGVTLFWVTDTSDGQRRTRALVDASVAMLASLVKVARLPGAAGIVEQLRGVLAVALPAGGGDE